MSDEQKTRRKSLRCRFGFHDYAKKVPANEGKPYLECTRCGKEDFMDSIRVINLGN